MPVKHQVAWSTLMGRTHRVNQDTGGAWSCTRPDGSAASLIAVADGVSAGHTSEEASRIAIDKIQERLLPLLSASADPLGTLREALVEAARDANHEIAKRPHVSGAYADATTLVAALCVGRQGVGMWCGDSRGYHAQSGVAIERVTRDHSWAEGVVSSGAMSNEQAAHDPRAHMITRWLGPPDQEDPGIEVFRFDLRAGDVVFCCSDGLYTYFAPPEGDEIEMATALQNGASSLQEAVDGLVQIALQRGGHDDITLSAMRLVDE